LVTAFPPTSCAASALRSDGWENFTTPQNP
jgi:hypothetical protein